MYTEDEKFRYSVILLGLSVFWDIIMSWSLPIRKIIGFSSWGTHIIRSSLLFLDFLIMMNNIIHRNVDNNSPILENLNLRQHGCENLKSSFNETRWGSTSLSLTTIGTDWSWSISNFQVPGSSIGWDSVFLDFLSSWIFSVCVDKIRYPPVN